MQAVRCRVLRAIQLTMSEPVKAALLANGPARRRAVSLLPCD